ncbi:DUF2318 domain-containing protein [Geobacter sp. DSM 9736]|uniref:DUF2318 domain-containing protein n=1 Tax=Geobacter sp. DSM 9736 TaxID=1277350 RepID=UPI000B5042C6|nr:DUF2318 domain-containing protein [Geobacter sp. DSM 9736]SNB45968.1 Predicted membrane protein [Geobacter sp. DSM 9736]
MKLKSLTISIIVLMVAAVAAAFTIPGMGKAQKVKAVNGAVTISSSNLNDGKARFYKINENGKEIVFFVVRAADGSVKAAFDACDACYREKKGYEQKGEVMVCRNCNMKFAIGRLGPNATGGCNPSYLPHREAGGNIIISVNDLKTGSRFF